VKIKIRFNTEKEKVDKTLRPWRVIMNGEEHLADQVIVKVPSWTSMDEIAPGLIKWHISCDGQCQWSEDRSICEII
jgi:hypothetical protein